MSNRSRLGLSLGELFEGLLTRPTVLLPELSGPFLVAVADDGGLLVATNKVAARPCYHAETPAGVVFGSAIRLLVPSLDSRTVDTQTVSDVLSFNMVFGEKMLLEEVQALPPATLHLGDGMEDVPYERTGLAPSRPLALHDATYVAKQLRWHLPTGRPGRLGDWVREHDDARRQTNRWLDAARDRSLFDGDAVETLREEHLWGEANHF